MALKKADIGSLGLRSKASPPKRFAREGATSAADYGDPEKMKYPLHKEENVKSAISYFGNPSNREGYSGDEQRRIAVRILRAARKFNIIVNPSSAISRLAGLKRK